MGPGFCNRTLAHFYALFFSPLNLLLLVYVFPGRSFGIPETLKSLKRG